ncbi:uncharacterized protein LOC143152702 [Ptiloglossa arizonensis]|uniref:uncharacterized protein LOC143152702 n=1 Tax=Ptiloglossa arizonensis TaxID=3350558 RepID=UPI003FA15F50
MIITRKVARWALLLKREALGRNYGAQKRSEQAPRGATAMLPRPGRLVDDNIDTDTDTDNTVATDLRMISSCVALALSLPFPYYYRYCPRAGIAASLFYKSERCTLVDDHEDDDCYSPLTNTWNDVPRPGPTSPIPGVRASSPAAAAAEAPIAAASTELKAEEQQDVAVHGVQEQENAPRGTKEEVVTVPESVDSNRRLSRQNVRGARFCA